MGIFKEFSHLELESPSFLVCCSGGVDSVAAAFAMDVLSKKLNLKMGLAYIHHGSAENEIYRNRAYGFVERLAINLKRPFYSNTDGNQHSDGNKSHGSEDSLRKLRREELIKIQQSQGYRYLVQGHHWDDLLETRLIRLIRGTGAGGLESMGVLSGCGSLQIYRPFLQIRRKELKSYVENKWSEGWLEDPSNKSIEPLRNWLRQEWLVSLEKKREGSVNSLGSSLELISQEVEKAGTQSSEQWEKLLVGEERICRRSYEALAEGDKKRFLAFYLKSKNVNSYTAGHVGEIYKRLRTEQKNFSFVVARCEWLVDTRHFGFS